MGLYARPSRRLVGQLAADGFVATWAVGWAFAGRLVHAAIQALAEPLRQAARMTGDLKTQVADAAGHVGSVPVAGTSLRPPLDGMVGNLDGIIAAATAQVAWLEGASVLAGWATFLAPVGFVVALWLPRRLRFAARSKATRDLLQGGDSADLLALRALANRRLTDLTAISADPLGDWRRGDPETIRRLRDLELVDAGVAPINGALRRG